MSGNGMTLPLILMKRANPRNNNKEPDLHRSRAPAVMRDMMLSPSLGTDSLPTYRRAAASSEKVTSDLKKADKGHGHMDESQTFVDLPASCRSAGRPMDHFYSIDAIRTSAGMEASLAEAHPPTHPPRAGREPSQAGSWLTSGALR